MDNFESEDKYDLIWLDDVCTVVSDPEIEIFLKKIQHNLKESHSLIVVKERCIECGFIVYPYDYFLTRSSKIYEDLFEKAQLKIIWKEESEK